MGWVGDIEQPGWQHGQGEAHWTLWCSDTLQVLGCWAWSPAPTQTFQLRASTRLQQPAGKAHKASGVQVCCAADRQQEGSNAGYLQHGHRFRQLIEKPADAPGQAHHHLLRPCRCRACRGSRGLHHPVFR